MVALAGMLTAPMLVALVLAALYTGVADNPLVQGALRGMGAVAAGLITATGIKMVGALGKNPMGMAGCIGLAVVTFVAIALVRVPLATLLLTLGVASCVWAYVKLGENA
jgi:chromate transporter